MLLFPAEDINERDISLSVCAKMNVDITICYIVTALEQINGLSVQCVGMIKRSDGTVSLEVDDCNQTHKYLCANGKGFTYSLIFILQRSSKMHDSHSYGTFKTHFLTFLIEELVGLVRTTNCHT